MLTFYGFILIVISHIADQLYPIAESGLQAGVQSGLFPTPLTNPFKIAGNIGALLLFIGLTLIIYRHLMKKDNAGNATYFDWLFVGLAYLITLCGISTEVLRLAGVEILVHWFYLAHLLFIFTLLVYSPFSKLTHMLYRTLAMTYAKQIGREVKSEVT